MSNGDTGRKAHIKRIFSTDGDVWVDVERIDELDVLIAGRQRVHYKFDWNNTGGMARKTLTDPHDPGNKIDIPIRKSVRLEGPRGIRNHYFLNDTSNKSRETHARRVYHHEIKEGYLESGDQPPRDPDKYKQSLGEQDQNQYIDVELLDSYWMAGDTFSDVHGHAARLFSGRGAGSSSVRGQNRQWLGTKLDDLLDDPIVEGDVPGGEPPLEPIKNPGMGKIDPPWRLDPLQNIVNVNWGGIAVELSNGGGLALQGDLHGLDQATVSVWFRYSAEALETAANDFADRVASGTPAVDYSYAGMVPILSWGTPTTGLSGGRTFLEGPCLIGIQTTYVDSDLDQPYLVLRFNSYAESAATAAGKVTRAGTEHFTIGYQAAGFTYTTDNLRTMKVDPETWHHLLVSWDVSSGSVGNCWLMLDGQAYDGAGGYFFPAGVGSMAMVGFSGGPNEIWGNYYFMQKSVGHVSVGDFEMPSDTFIIPNKGTYVPQPIELADLQIFTDTAGDVVPVYSAFVTDKGTPEAPAKAEEIMGKKPEILLRGVPNWQTGMNTGSLGIDEAGNPRDEGQFAVHPDIKSFKPNPKLGR